MKSVQKAASKPNDVKQPTKPANETSTEPTTVTSSSTLDLYLQLEKQANDLKKRAETELTTDIAFKLEILNKLGHNYRLVDARAGTLEEKPKKPIVKKTPSYRYNKEYSCTICHMEGHDVRAHNLQQGERRPFTNEELSAKGWMKPEEAKEATHAA